MSGPYFGADEEEDQRRAQRRAELKAKADASAAAAANAGGSWLSRALDIAQGIGGDIAENVAYYSKVAPASTAGYAIGALLPGVDADEMSAKARDLATKVASNPLTATLMGGPSAAATAPLVGDLLKARGEEAEGNVARLEQSNLPEFVKRATKQIAAPDAGMLTPYNATTETPWTAIKEGITGHASLADTDFAKNNLSPGVAQALDFLTDPSLYTGTGGALKLGGVLTKGKAAARMADDVSRLMKTGMSAETAAKVAAGGTSLMDKATSKIGGALEWAGKKIEAPFGADMRYLQPDEWLEMIGDARAANAATASKLGPMVDRRMAALAQIEEYAKNADPATPEGARALWTAEQARAALDANRIRSPLPEQAEIPFLPFAVPGDAQKAFDKARLLEKAESIGSISPVRETSIPKPEPGAPRTIIENGEIAGVRSPGAADAAYALAKMRDAGVPNLSPAGLSPRNQAAEMQRLYTGLANAQGDVKAFERTYGGGVTDNELFSNQSVQTLRNYDKPRYAPGREQELASRVEDLKKQVEELRKVAAPGVKMKMGERDKLLGTIEKFGKEAEEAKFAREAAAGEQAGAVAKDLRARDAKVAEQTKVEVGQRIQQGKEFNAEYDETGKPKVPEWEKRVREQREPVGETPYDIEKAALEKALPERQSAYDAAKAEHDAVLQKRDEVVKRITDLDDRRAQLAAELKEAKTAYNVVKGGKSAEQKKNAAALVKKIESKMSAMEKVDAQIGKLKSEAKGADEAIARTRPKLDETSSALDEAMARKKKLSEDDQIAIVARREAEAAAEARRARGVADLAGRGRQSTVEAAKEYADSSKKLATPYRRRILRQLGERGRQLSEVEKAEADKFTGAKNELQDLMEIRKQAENQIARGDDEEIGRLVGAERKALPTDNARQVATKEPLRKFSSLTPDELDIVAKWRRLSVAGATKTGAEARRNADAMTALEQKWKDTHEGSIDHGLFEPYRAAALPGKTPEGVPETLQASADKALASLEALGDTGKRTAARLREADPKEMGGKAVNERVEFRQIVARHAPNWVVGDELSGYTLQPKKDVNSKGVETNRPMKPEEFHEIARNAIAKENRALEAENKPTIKFNPKKHGLAAFGTPESQLIDAYESIRGDQAAIARGEKMSGSPWYSEIGIRPDAALGRADELDGPLFKYDEITDALDEMVGAAAEGPGVVRSYQRTGDEIEALQNRLSDFVEKVNDPKLDAYYRAHFDLNEDFADAQRREARLLEGGKGDTPEYRELHNKIGAVINAGEDLNPKAREAFDRILSEIHDRHRNRYPEVAIGSAAGREGQELSRLTTEGSDISRTGSLPEPEGELKAPEGFLKPGKWEGTEKFPGSGTISPEKPPPTLRKSPERQAEVEKFAADLKARRQKTAVDLEDIADALDSGKLSLPSLKRLLEGDMTEAQLAATGLSKAIGDPIKAGTPTVKGSFSGTDFGGKEVKTDGAHYATFEVTKTPSGWDVVLRDKAGRSSTFHATNPAQLHEQLARSKGRWKIDDGELPGLPSGWKVDSHGFVRTMGGSRPQWGWDSYKSYAELAKGVGRKIDPETVAIIRRAAGGEDVLPEPEEIRRLAREVRGNKEEMDRFAKAQEAKSPEAKANVTPGETGREKFDAETKAANRRVRVDEGAAAKAQVEGREKRVAAAEAKAAEANKKVYGPTADEATPTEVQAKAGEEAASAEKEARYEKIAKWEASKPVEVEAHGTNPDIKGWTVTKTSDGYEVISHKPGVAGGDGKPQTFGTWLHAYDYMLRGEKGTGSAPLKGMPALPPGVKIVDGRLKLTYNRDLPLYKLPDDKLKSYIRGAEKADIRGAARRKQEEFAAKAAEEAKKNAPPAAKAEGKAEVSETGTPDYVRRGYQIESPIAEGKVIDHRKDADGNVTQVMIRWKSKTGHTRTAWLSIDAYEANLHSGRYAPKQGGPPSPKAEAGAGEPPSTPAAKEGADVAPTKATPEEVWDEAQDGIREPSEAGVELGRSAIEDLPDKMPEVEAEKIEVQPEKRQYIPFGRETAERVAPTEHRTIQKGFNEIANRKEEFQKRLERHGSVKAGSIESKRAALLSAKLIDEEGNLTREGRALNERIQTKNMELAEEYGGWENIPEREIYTELQEGGYGKTSKVERDLADEWRKIDDELFSELVDKNMIDDSRYRTNHIPFIFGGEDDPLLTKGMVWQSIKNDVNLVYARRRMDELRAGELDFARSASAYIPAVLKKIVMEPKLKGLAQFADDGKRLTGGFLKEQYDRDLKKHGERYAKFRLKYAEDYIRGRLGGDMDTYENVERMLAEKGLVEAFHDKPGAVMVSEAQKAITSYAMGLNVASAVKNWIGGQYNLLTQLAGGYKGRGLLYNLAMPFADYAKGFYTFVTSDAARKIADKHGVTKEYQRFLESMVGDKNKKQRAFMNFLMAPTRFVENLNRGVAFYAGMFQHLRSKGITSSNISEIPQKVLAEAMEKGHVLSDESNFLYGAAHRSPYAKNSLGNLGYQFTEFTMAQGKFTIDKMADFLEGVGGMGATKADRAKMAGLLMNVGLIGGMALGLSRLGISPSFLYDWASPFINTAVSAYNTVSEKATGSDEWNAPKIGSGDRGPIPLSPFYDAMAAIAKGDYERGMSQMVGWAIPAGVQINNLLKSAGSAFNEGVSREWMYDPIGKKMLYPLGVEKDDRVRFGDLLSPKLTPMEMIFNALGFQHIRDAQLSRMGREVAEEKERRRSEREVRDTGQSRLTRLYRSMPLGSRYKLSGYLRDQWEGR